MADILDESFDELPEAGKTNLPTVPEIPKATRAPKSSIPASTKEKRVRIIVGEGDAQDNPFVFVQVNGVGYQIMRGEEVSVPMSVKHVLDNAIVTVMVRGADKKMRPRRQMRFPYATLGEAA
jgi:hypothetical protein